MYDEADRPAPSVAVLKVAMRGVDIKTGVALEYTSAPSTK